VGEARAGDWRGYVGIEAGEAHFGVGTTRAAGVCEDMRTLRKVIVFGPVVVMMEISGDI